MYFVRLYISTPDSPVVASSSLTAITILDASTESTVPPLFATIVTPESVATILSIPVPTSGLSAKSVGTACLCILDPIRALLASSCSRKGINEAAIDTICFGETSIYSIVSGGIKVNSFLYLAEISSSSN